MQNCLFDRTFFWFKSDDVNDLTQYFTAQNCFFRFSPLHLYSAYQITDCLFDQPTFYSIYIRGAVVGSNNGYTTGSALVPGATGGNDKTNLTANFESGPLGSYYYPASGATNTLTALIDAGSRTNAGLAGLYHHTTVVGQTKETNSVLDIGFHFVAVNPAESEVPKTPSGMAPSASSVYDANWTVDKATNGVVTDYGWHNRADGWNEEPAWLRINLLSSKPVSRLGYIGRDGGGNGVYRDYKIYVTDSSSTNAADWGTEVAAGQWLWPNGKERRDAEFGPKSGQYVILRRITAEGYHGPSGTDPGYANANEVWIYTRNTMFSTPLDSDGDGLADHLEDRNGNGALNSGETDWNSPSDLGFKVLITQPKAASPIP